MNMDILSRLPILMRLDASAVEKIAQLGEFQDLREGDVLCKEAQEAQGVIWIISGRIKTSVSLNEGEEAVVDILTKGRMLGLAEVCDGGAYCNTAQAIEKAKVFRLPAKAFQDLLSESFEFQMAVFARVSAEMRGAVKEINDLNLKNTSRRLGAYILGLTTKEEGQVTIDLPFGKKLLAARLAMKPESLSRALAKLKAIGVESKKNQIMIADVEALGEYCGLDDMVIEGEMA
ncbi:putative transcriptional activator protein fnrA [Candidatus Terasakiella magnetica]|uniref:Putative transcriptional activator protein fnrA n=1 Tax=Candidatus Terasakiella magnetica TaxID=1867952 RepID=A0A1C3RK33_9PROT|nr:cyclic nucleotide-binding domain-containing protein [Candidatus Terasakiella magnetica]SCA57650.1 putative transcriptional activator protein fnrA [Candidatus Terasakiella magnetica]